MRARLIGAIIPVLLAGCGGSSLDGEGLAGNSSADQQFTRASQLYFRGRLTASLEEFNGVVYRFPDSPFAEDARLAVRRIECDLTGQESFEESGIPEPSFSSRIAVVGRVGASAGVTRAAALMRSAGASVSELTDSQAPEMTVVFFSAGFESEAATVADSLEHWLQRPEEVISRPGDELIETVAPGFDVMVILGDDALFEEYAE